MGKKSSWFCSLALSSSKRSNSKKGFGTSKSLDSIVTSYEDLAPFAVPTTPPALAAPPPPPPPPPLRPSAPADVKLSSEAENEQSKHAYSVALATAAAAEAAVAAAQAAAEVVRLTTAVRSSGKPKEEIAAIKIQTAFRGYMARRALRALRGLVRLKTLLQGQSVKRQANSTLRAMQTLARLQSQIRVRRIRMAEENQSLQRQIQHKHEKELERLTSSVTGAEWDDSMQSKQQIEASLLHRQEAAVRRERALAYAYSHQQTWKKSSKNGTATFMDPNNPHWGWSWLERWMAARPWESTSGVDSNNDQASLKSAISRTVSLGEISRSYSRRDLHYNNKASPSGQRSSRPPSRQSPSTPGSKAPSFASVTGKMKGPSPRGSSSTWGGDDDDDSRSMFSVQSERYRRRHSIAGSSVRDDESLGSSPSVPSYLGVTQSAKAKSRFSGLMGLDKKGDPDKASVASAKKRLTFSPSSAGLRRHSGPPKIDSTRVKKHA